MDRGACWATVHVVAKSRTQRSDPAACMVVETLPLCSQELGVKTWTSQGQGLVSRSSGDKHLSVLGTLPSPSVHLRAVSEGRGSGPSLDNPHVRVFNRP